MGSGGVGCTRVELGCLRAGCSVVGLCRSANGGPRTLSSSVDATTLEGARQTIALGPVASQEAIKLLGTNGGGFFNANSAHPFENPTALTNFVEMLSILAIGVGLTWCFGKAVGDRKSTRLNSSH